MTAFTYETTATIDAIAERMRSARKVLVTSHEKPDGDAIGSCAAVARALRALDIETEAQKASLDYLLLLSSKASGGSGLTAYIDFDSVNAFD